MPEDTQRSINQITIAAINVNSIIAHYRRYELMQFMQNYNHDIILLSETKLNKNHKITFKDYHIVRTNRPNAKQGGGTAIIIKRSIPFDIINYPSLSLNEILEYSIIKISTYNNYSLYIISAYAKNDNHKLFIDELDHLFDNLKLHINSNYFILASDLNARRKAWGDRSNNQRGKYLSRWEENQVLRFKCQIIVPEHPTFKPARTYLDVCLAIARLNLSCNDNHKASTLPYDSDHSTISLMFEINHDNIPIRLTTDHRFNYKSTKWEKFTKRLSELYHNNIPIN